MSMKYGAVALIVYISALVPVVLLLALRAKRVIPAWVSNVYLAMFAVCAVGWEIWFTYGWAGGLSVEMRRAEELNALIPVHINWVLNSLADAGAIGMTGLLFVWLLCGRTDAVFRSWHWKAFVVLLVWFVGQNLFVELFLYHEQLAAGKALSWAPLVPTGPWYNPTLFHFMGRTATLQGQVSWVLATPLLYGLTIFFRNRKLAGK